MDILVTGGTGFIGQKLVKRLLSHNHHVSVLVRETSDTSVLPDAVKLEKGNLLDRESLDEIVKDNGIVFHLAAYFDFYPSDTDLMYRVNVDGTRMLAEACAEASVSQFIYSSSTEAIGPVNNPPADEETEPQPAFDYGKSK
ncbi:MAG: NAD-dependent epimerase/dehydratase family protein, partial [Promethearchaeia archaeon]